MIVSSLSRLSVDQEADGDGFVIRSLTERNIPDRNEERGAPAPGPDNSVAIF